MRLKTFSGKKSADVLAMIKAEFGDNAIILETSEENGRISITAALEREACTTLGHHSDVQDDVRFLTVPSSSSGTLNWHDEWRFIKKHMLSLLKPTLCFDELAPRQKLALEYLQQEGVSDEPLLELFCALKKRSDGSVLSSLNKLVPIRSWHARNWPEKVHCLAGPFGSGKTSCALRLALLFRQEEPAARVCIVNADAGRGNGRLFLRHYAELSDLSYWEAASPLDLARVLARLAQQNFDRIFIDLPGFSKERSLLAYLEQSGLRPDETSFFGLSWREDFAVHLVLAPYMDEGYLRDVLRRYHSGFAGSIVYTKLDEVGKYGQILNISQKTGLPVSAFSFGPGLGGSLSPAAESTLWRMVFRRELPGDETA